MFPGSDLCGTDHISGWDLYGTYNISRVGSVWHIYISEWDLYDTDHVCRICTYDTALLQPHTFPRVGVQYDKALANHLPNGKTWGSMK